MSLSVYIARQSGDRARPWIAPKSERKNVWRDAVELLTEDIDETRPDLQLAQLSLARCHYLQTEFTAIEKKAPEAATAVARMCVETALVGSYLALSDDGDIADRMTKGLETYARRLQTRFKEGQSLAGIDLLPDIPIISDALAPRLQDVRKGRSLYSICEELDRHMPFADGKLAMLLYEETYTVLSNHVVHPTILTLSRHSAGSVLARFSSEAPLLLSLAEAQANSRPSRLDVRGAGWTASAATVALTAALARGLGRPSDEWDRGAQDIGAIDGYIWSGSPARMIGAHELARMADLPSLTALNTAGLLISATGATEPFQDLATEEKLVCASEIFDMVRAWWQKLGRLPMISPTSVPVGGPQTEDICTGAASSSVQASLAAVGLVYAGALHGRPVQLDTILDTFDQTAPHRTGVLSTLQDSTPRELLNTWRRARGRVEARTNFLP